MKKVSEQLLTIPIALLSIIFTVLNALLTTYLLHSFFSSKQQTKASVSNAQNQPTNQQPAISPHKEPMSESIAPYFKYTASITVIFNTLNSLFNTFSCIYLIYDPQHDDPRFYIHHSSHIQRIISTVCWYIAKVSLIYVITGRLYKSFYGSVYSVDKKFIIYINIFNTIIAPIGLVCGYYGVFTGNLILAEIGLNLIARILYEVISLTVLYMFSKRLLLLSMRNINVRVAEPMTVTVTKGSVLSTATTVPSMPTTATPTTTNIAASHHLVDANKKPELEIVPQINIKRVGKSEVALRADIEHTMFSTDYFMRITTRNAILMLTISISVVFVIFSFFGFRFIFGRQTRLTLAIPMNMAACDSLITSVCVFCFFACGEKLYYLLCGPCDRRCKGLCREIAHKTLLS